MFKIGDRVSYIVGNKPAYNGIIKDVSTWKQIHGAGAGNNICYQMESDSGYISWYGTNSLRLETK